MQSTTTPTKSKTMQPRGFAIIIVVFFSVIILISMTSAAFYSAIR